MGPDQVDTLRRTQKSTGELLALITATLDIGRLETGKGLLDVQEIDLGELSREIAGETTSLRETPTVSVAWDVPAELPRPHTDRAKLKVVVKNLLANAVKFTEHGQVTVRARACDGGVEIAVADTGIGIGPDVLPIIFEPFRQAESGATSRRGGVGLGLYIVRRYLDLLGGTIRVESELGRGSTFRVWLPAGAPAGIP
jgi:signal transduction histidine kinase